MIYATCSEVKNIYKSLAFSQKAYRNNNDITLKMWEVHLSANMNVLQRGMFLNQNIHKPRGEKKKKENMEYLSKEAFYKAMIGNALYH